MKIISEIIKKSLDGSGDEEERFEEALETIDGMVLYTDENGKIFYLNDQFADFLGKKREDLIGKMEADFFPGEIHELCKKNNKIVIKTGILNKIEVIDEIEYEVYKNKISKDGSCIKIFTYLKKRDC